MSDKQENQYPQNNLAQSEGVSFEKVFEAAAKREEAISTYFRQEEILQEIAQKVRSESGFDFATIQLIRPEEKTIEAVTSAEWVGRSEGIDYQVTIDKINGDWFKNPESHNRVNGRNRYMCSHTNPKRQE
jgi:hypothetical protein